jgi:hypothetical protein
VLKSSGPGWACAVQAASLPASSATSGDSVNEVGGFSGNIVSVGVVGATIAGGGSSLGCGSPPCANQVSHDFGTVAGGQGNRAGGDFATVGGGNTNTASGVNATVAGGLNNTATGRVATVGGGSTNHASATAATIAGGQGNLVADFAASATVGGGESNSAEEVGATVAGGVANHVSPFAPWATVGGGLGNTAGNSLATVGGGNTNTASGVGATIPGGISNVAGGEYTFAAGRRAQATHRGAFVWADSSDFDFPSTAADELGVRATGGVRLVLGVDGGAGGTPTWTCSVVAGGSWACSSDRNLKENLVLVDGQEILRRLGQVPIFRWNARGTDPHVTHVGPTAQDFHAAFGLGDSDRLISTIDAEGVALAAIQALHARNQALEAETRDLAARARALESRLAEVDTLRVRLGALERLLEAREMAWRPAGP